MMREDRKYMICCIIGHTPKEFPFPYEENSDLYCEYCDVLSNEVEILLKHGYDYFILGADEGTDFDIYDCLWKFCQYSIWKEVICWEIALANPIPIVKQLTGVELERNDMMMKSEKVYIAAPHFEKDCVQKRDQYMIDNADIVLFVWNGIRKGRVWNAIQYARKHQKTIHYIMLQDIERYSYEDFTGLRLK